MVFIVAGIITVIVFVMLFRSGKDKDKIVDLTPPQVVDIQPLENRIKALETLVADLEKNSVSAALSTPSSSSSPSIDSYKARVERVEAALSTKFDLVAARLSFLEKKIEGVERSTRGTAKAAPAPKAALAPKTVAAPPVAKPVSKPEPQKPAPQKPAAATATHTVKKGETLYGISREYQTTVEKLRALNNLSEKTDIFPGQTLVVKP